MDEIGDVYRPVMSSFTRGSFIGNAAAILGGTIAMAKDLTFGKCGTAALAVFSLNQWIDGVRLGAVKWESPELEPASKSTIIRKVVLGAIGLACSGQALAYGGIVGAVGGAIASVVSTSLAAVERTTESSACMVSGVGLIAAGGALCATLSKNVPAWSAASLAAAVAFPLLKKLNEQTWIQLAPIRNTINPNAARL